MSKNAIAFGPTIWSKGLAGFEVNAVFQQLESDGFTAATDDGLFKPLTLREGVQALSAGLDSLILLPGWEEHGNSLALGRVAQLLGVELLQFAGPSVGLKLVDACQLTKAIDVNHAAVAVDDPTVVAPDSDLIEPPHEEAARIVLGPRGDYYDTPLRNLGRTGTIWTGLLQSKLREGETVSAEDVSLCMVGLKLARQAFRYKRDNITDAHGYLMTIEMIRAERTERGEDVE